VATGIELYRSNKKQDAFNLFSKLYKDKPDDPDVNYYLGLLYTDLGKPDVAMGYYLKTKSVNDKYKYVASELCYVNLQLKDLPTAVEYGKKSIQDYPEYMPAYITLAALFSLTGDWDSFEKYLTMGAQVDPEFVLQQADMVYVKYGQPELAMRYYDILHAIIPKNPFLLHHMGAVQDTLHNSAKAFEYYREAYLNCVYDKKTFFTIYASYMWSLIRQNQTAQMRKDAFLKVDAQYADAYYYTALSYYIEGNDALFTENAAKYFTLKSEPKPADYSAWAEGILGKWGMGRGK
jgi:tetratricopeptide (TPR) repeat protein